MHASVQLVSATHPQRGAAHVCAWCLACVTFLSDLMADLFRLSGPKKKEIFISPLPSSATASLDSLTMVASKGLIGRPRVRQQNKLSTRGGCLPIL